jgi:hypothetical protein
VKAVGDRCRFWFKFARHDLEFKVSSLGLRV